MAKQVKNLVDEGFRISLVETAFFDGVFEIPHIDGPKEIIIPTGMVPFSQRERSRDHEDFVCFYENDINFREILTEHLKNITKRYPDLPAVMLPDKQMTFRELYDYALRAAGKLAEHNCYPPPVIGDFKTQKI